MKQLFINSLLSMVDSETVFMASREYWGNIFDAIEAGKTENIDPTFVTVYRTIKAVDLVKKNPQFNRLNEILATRRMLLAAIDSRLKGQNVVIVCRDQQSIKIIENEFFRLVGMVTSLLSLGGKGGVDMLTRGSIRFVSLSSRQNHDSFSWSQRRMHGMDSKDVFYIAPALVEAHYSPILAEYERNSSEIVLSDSMQKIENDIVQMDTSRAKKMKALAEQAKGLGGVLNV